MHITPFPMFALFVELEARTVNHAQERSDEILDSGAGRRLLDRRGTPDSICGPFGGAYSIVKHSVYRVLYATLGRVI